jgi:phosphocarrier protein
MVEKTVTINNKAGIHCRPSSVILQEVEKFPGHTFEVTSDKGSCGLSSILELLAIGLQFGDKVTVKVSGPDEEKACEKFAELFAYEFDFPPQ